MIGVDRLNSKEWFDVSEAAHKLVFKELRSPDLDRIDFALLVNNGKEAIGYVTCRETDSESLYWCYGGTIVEYRGFDSVRAFKEVFDYCAKRYKRITTLVKNDNVNYLHLIMKHGFRAIGLRCFGNEIFLEMFWGEQ